MKKIFYVLLVVFVTVGAYSFLQDFTFNQEIKEIQFDNAVKIENDKNVNQKEDQNFIRNEIITDLSLDQIKPMAIAKVNLVILDDLKLILNQNDADKIDKAVGLFVQDKNIPRTAKISGLLGLVKDFGVNSVQGIYLLDVLGSLKPIEIADKLIHIFNTDEASGETKSVILNVLADSYGMEPNKYDSEVAKLIAGQSLGIQEFFTQQIQNPNDVDMYRQAIKLYPSVASEAELDLLNDSLVNHQDLIPIQEILAIRLEASLVDADVQNNLLPELLDNVTKSGLGADIKQQFNKQLFSVVNDPSSEIIFDETIKPQLAAYIREQEPLLTADNLDFNDIYNYSSWIEAYAKSVARGDRVEFIANYLASSASSVQQAVTIVSAENDLLYKIQQNPAIGLSMSDALSDPKMPSAAKTLIGDAMQRLQSKI